MPDFRVHAVTVPAPGAVEAQDTLVEHSHYINSRGQDMPEIRNWTWTGVSPYASGSQRS
jgi:phosphoketolase